MYKVYEVLSSPKKQSNVEVFYGLLLFSLGKRKRESSKSHMSTLVSPAFEAIFLFELCNEAWTFEVAQMSSSLAKEKAKKVITQFIRPSLQYLPAAKTFVKH